MGKTDTWMPLYIGDYLADTMHLDYGEHGAYVLLIMHYWRNGPLPDNDKALAAIARTPRQVWERQIGPVVRGFFQAIEGRLHHKRVDAELAHAAVVSAKRQAAANARHSKAKEAAEAVQEPCKSDANALQMDPHARIRPSASPSQSPKEVRTVTTFRQPEQAVVVPLNARSELFREGLKQVCDLTGRPPDKVRPFLGKMLKATQDDAAVVMQCIREATELRPADPTSWLTAAVKARDPRRMSTTEKIAAEWDLLSLDEMDKQAKAAWTALEAKGMLQ